MVRYWVVRAAAEIQEIVEKRSFAGISYSWTEDLTGLSREEIREGVKQHNPDDTQTTGQLYRFASEITEGDVVLTPITATRRVLFGRVAGPYRFNPKAPLEHETHTRRIQWLRTDVSRDDLSTGFRNALGGLMTVFNLDGHADEIERVIRREIETAPSTAVREVDDPQDEQSNAGWAAEVEADARDRIATLLYERFTDYEFERLVAQILEAMEYRTRGRYQPGSDGGVDITATRDVLGLDPERLKVQVKHQRGKTASKDVRELKGTLVGNERGLFVSLGGFTSDALGEGAPGLRLVNGNDFIDLLIEYYDRLSVEWQTRLRLKRVYLPAGEI